MRLWGLFLLWVRPLQPCSLPAQEPNPELVLKSYLYTYPGKVRDLSRAGGDWTIRIGDETFYWARGRLLPEKLRDSWESYRPHTFSVYPETVPAPESLSPEEIEELRLLSGNAARLDREDQHRAFQGPSTAA
jgi:hypothetical protein